MALTPDQWDRLRAELVARVEDLAGRLLPTGRKVRGVYVSGDVHGGEGDSFNLALSGPKAGQRVAMSYWRLPDSALDEPDQACIWGRRALDVARAAAKPKKPKKAALKRP